MFNLLSRFCVYKQWRRAWNARNPQGEFAQAGLAGVNFTQEIFTGESNGKKTFLLATSFADIIVQCRIHVV